MDRVVQRNKIVKCSTARMVFASDRCLSQVPMTVTIRIVALAIEPDVLGSGKLPRVQSMGCVERHLHSEKNCIAVPCFREEIGPLVEMNAMCRHHCIQSWVDVFGDIFRCIWSCFWSV